METTVSLGILEGVPLALEVELGRRSITLGELLRLETGLVISLSRRAGGPLDLYAGGSQLGRAEVVSRHGKRKIQITEVGHVE